MQNKFTLTHDDEITGIRTLPEDLKKQASELIVNRQGTTDRSFMRTESFLGFVAPNKNYQLTINLLFFYNSDPLTNIYPKKMG